MDQSLRNGDYEPNELLAEIASLYYETGLRQSAIAERIGMSRSDVSRLLKQTLR